MWAFLPPFLRPRWATCTLALLLTTKSAFAINGLVAQLSSPKRLFPQLNEQIPLGPHIYAGFGGGPGPVREQLLLHAGLRWLMGEGPLKFAYGVSALAHPDISKLIRRPGYSPEFMSYPSSFMLSALKARREPAFAIGIAIRTLGAFQLDSELLLIPLQRRIMPSAALRYIF